MKKSLPLALLSSLLSISFAVAAEPEIVGDDACFVVSGGKFDHNGALSELVRAERAGTKYSFAGYKCSIFNSYRELKNHLAISGIPKDSPIFILQVAHGGLGGTSALNSGTILPAQLLKEIREIGASYRVAFLNQSCYSGTVVQEKILWEEANTGSESIDRTCMWADAVPGRVAVGLNNVLRSKNPYNLEEAYAAAPVGVVSSAAWSEIGMAKYYKAIGQYPGYRLKEKVVVEELSGLSSNFLSGMGKIIAQNDEVEKSTEVIFNSAKFVLAPKTNDAQIKAFMGVAKAAEYDFEKVRAGTFDTPVSDNICTTSIRKFVQAQWFPVFRMHQAVWGIFLSKMKTELVANKEFQAACPDSGVERNLTSMDWAKWLGKHSPVGVQLEPYARALDSVIKVYPELLGESLNLQTIVNEVDLENGISPRGKTEILLSIIGRTILDEESTYIPIGDGTRSLAGFPNLRVEGATGNVLPAFNLASLKQEELRNPLDERRRNACRSIQLKAW